MKKLICIIGIFIFFQTAWSQTEYDDEAPAVGSSEEFVGFNKKKKEKKDLSRIRIGGTGGLLIANNQLGFSLSPLIGYQLVEDRIEIGTGIIYDLYRYKDPRNKYMQHTVGTNNYLRLYIWEGLFAQGRGVYQKSYAKLNTQTQTPLKWGNIFAGAGYQFPLGDKAFMNIGLEINILPYDLNVVNQRAERVIAPFFNFQFSL